MSDSKTTETANITMGRACIRNKIKESTDTDFKSALTEHAATSNHVIDWDNVKVIEQGHNWTLWGIKKAIYIHANPMSLNRPQGERYASRCLGLSLGPTTAA